ncbi:MAG TPA: peptidase C69 [Bacteroidales bacterium]|nr:MAG: peptidase C69 [Bacteroidetes bacterium GWE2_42_24]OFY25542.1 MAG: peptidase C69 [Bacteroidetes bacterium GWF2_43_11]HAQ66075.1 peptidase C69 [Bacteroidales bacterium]HBZ66375.1 peptidase C69 [Bacteroidales bacterium]
MNKLLSIALTALILSCTGISAQVDRSDWEAGLPDGCTSVTCGKLATVDGSVITSHTDDSHRTRSNVLIQPAADHKPGTMFTLCRRVALDTVPMNQYKDVPVGSIPQVAHTYGYINSAYACMNEHQLGLGESTFGGREELISDKGMIDCQRLYILMLERCTTARDAIRLAGDLLEKYGWNDAGECVTIADKNEVWALEIVGPGKGKVGAIWVAQRVPDGHISVNANASTIKEVNLDDRDHFMASSNIFSVAKEHGWWKEGETFRWCYAYAPESRTSLASRRREWRVFDLAAPSLKLDPNAENYPFSIKPDSLITLSKLVSIFKDYYEGTDFDMVKDQLVPDKDGKMVISPLANPHMPYEMNKMLRINGGWGWRGERTIARWYTMYATIIQCRSWLPDEVGGVTWMAMDNVATSIYIPIYASVKDLPETYKTDGRKTGFSSKSAWWAFNRLGTLTAQRWGDMRKDVNAVWNPWQKQLFTHQQTIEADALKLLKAGKRDKAIDLLNGYTNEWGNKVVNEAWRLGDHLWTKYDELF